MRNYLIIINRTSMVRNAKKKMAYNTIPSTITIIQLSKPFTPFSLKGLVRNSKMFKPAIQNIGSAEMPNRVIKRKLWRK